MGTDRMGARECYREVILDNIEYSYLVQDRRRVETPAGTFEVWVVTRQLTDTLGGLFPATQQLWFAPFVGEVRSPEGLLLTGRNFAQAGK